MIYFLQSTSVLSFSIDVVLSLYCTLLQIIIFKALQNHGACPREPDIIVVQGDFNECIGLNTTTGYSSTKLQYHTSYPKMKNFPVTLQGPGLSCRSAIGIVVYAVSVNGSTVRCNLRSDLLSNGVVRCNYRCKCPDVCSLLEAYIYNSYPASLCQIIT